MLKSVTVIGDGGAFDIDKTNSSFLIEIEHSVETDEPAPEGRWETTNILYDCGYNVFPKLVKTGVIVDIDAVIISHDDDDHMGSVKSLLYYRYHKFGKSTKVICPPHMVEMFESINREMVSSVFVESEMLDVQSVEEKVRLDRDYLLSKKHGHAIMFIEGIHHTPVYGLIVRDSYENMVAISGHTKANSAFGKKVDEMAGGHYEKVLLFQDYSPIDMPSRQLHACDTDIRDEYSQAFRDNMIPYHNADAGLEDAKFVFSPKFGEPYRKV